jgi:crossover junction endodeoxyribonuclease RuvC
MKVLAVDPGYDRLGVAVMERRDGTDRLLYSSCILTEKTAAHPARLGAVGAAFAALLRDHVPEVVAIESLFFNKNQTTAIGVAEARGVILYLADAAACSVREFTPQEIKVAVTGYGKSDKRAVTDMVRRLVPEAPQGALDDEYDAIAIAITALASSPR